MNRAEHLQWAKDRANEYLDRGETREGMASFISDLKKYDQTEDILHNPLVSIMLMGAVMSGEIEECKRAVNEVG